MKIKKFVSRSPIPAIIATELVLMRRLNKELARSRLNYVEALVLTTLFFENDHKINSPSMMARNLLLPLPRLSAAITSLCREGLMARELDSKDSRSLKLKLTARGQRRALEAVEMFDANQRWIEKCLGEKVSDDLTGSLLRLRSAMLEKQ